MDTALVLIGAALLIGGIAWWFFGKRTTGEVEATMTDGEQQVDVTVNGGYTPNVVVLRQGVPAQVVFQRKDPSACFDEVMLPDFGIHETLPVNTPHPIEIDTSKPGEYSYACGMNMFHGKVIVK